MTNTMQHFYDGLADHYHRIYESWEDSIDRQASALDDLIKSNGRISSPEILDCSCGIGTQTLAKKLVDKFVSSRAEHAHRHEKRLVLVWAQPEVVVESMVDTASQNGARHLHGVGARTSV